MFGFHVDRVWAPAGSPVERHIEAARRWAADEHGFDARAAQIFVAGPRSYSLITTPGDAAGLRRYVDETGLALFAHGTYLDFPWGGSAPAAASIRRELGVCAAAGIRGLVVHLGTTPPGEVARRLPALLEGAPPQSAPPRLFLEVPAVLPRNAHYATPEGFAALVAAVREVDPRLERVGFCVDTAHLWACGADLRTRAAAEAWLQPLEGALPPGRLLFHLNDSLSERGSGKDAHAAFFAGKIWGGYRAEPRRSGLAAFVDFAVRHRVPAVAERKRDGIAADLAALARITRAADA